MEVKGCDNCKHGRHALPGKYVCSKHFMTDEMIRNQFCYDWEKDGFDFKWWMWSNEPVIKDVAFVNIVSEDSKKEEEKMKLSDFIKK